MHTDGAEISFVTTEGHAGPAYMKSVKQALIPAALNYHLCALAVADGPDYLRQPHQSVPAVAACVDDILMVLVQPVTELIAPEVLPDVLGEGSPGSNFRAAGITVHRQTCPGSDSGSARRGGNRGLCPQG